MADNPFGAPAGGASGDRWLVPLLAASFGALGGLLAWLLIPVPLLAGLVPMLCGNWAVRRLLASGPGRRSWQWRGTLGVSLGVTGIGVAWFVGMLLWRVVGV